MPDLKFDLDTKAMPTEPAIEAAWLSQWIAQPILHGDLGVDMFFTCKQGFTFGQTATFILTVLTRPWPDKFLGAAGSTGCRIVQLTSRFLAGLILNLHRSFMDNKQHIWSTYNCWKAVHDGQPSSEAGLGIGIPRSIL
jgi:hypothetical protein